MVDHVLGIDGGGSTTRVMIADRSGTITHTAFGEGTNPLDNPRWRQTLGTLLSPFASSPPLGAVAAALPAYGEVAELSAAQDHIVAGVFGDVPRLLLNDVDAAQIGAFANGPGILLLSGTGSMAWARDSAGRSYRVGGWGDLIGDEGSAYWIGRRILSLATQSIDGRTPPSALAKTLFQHLQLDIGDPANSLEGWVVHLTHPRSEIGALAPLATQLAQAGDAAAIGLIEQAAEELAKHVAAISRFVAAETPWSFGGGSFSSPVLLDAVAVRVGRPPVSPHLPPIGGALLAAAKLADWTVDSSWIARLGATLQQASRQAHQVPMTA